MTTHFNPLNEGTISETWPPSFKAMHRPGFYRNKGKRAFETLVVLCFLPMVVPLIFLLAMPMVVRGEYPFYSQHRVGRGGRIFVMWKLRSMVLDADGSLAHYLRENPSAREEWATWQKLRNDPRITGYGRFLRKLSLDELPQLWNVLRGEMALIGPRPMMPQQLDLYSGISYYALRPGISGYWQVSTRNDAAFVSRAHFDDKYDRELSFTTDLMLIARTLRVVLRGTGI
jgi:lipopolysaccharide/colanic/teichoic acid biosynthesis glycosyltransferase